MPTATAVRFRDDLAAVRQTLISVNADLANMPWRKDGWTRKHILGHLLDSAANNRQRFVRATLDGSYAGPGYEQDKWVALHGYAEQSWQTLLRWWQAEHEILAELVDRIPEERLDSRCVVGDDNAVSLQFLIEDYVAHQQHHLGQITAK
jgi:DinB superfamily